MKNRVVKAKNLVAFRIWLEKLGYSVTCDLSGNALAMQLGEEFEDHLKA